ncbi:hypothetical protein [Photorhabdus bodei]|uniref:Uncharacterized protein n=1 Tax=Photorhabdus bodei TaxID=2029681 RepID=A0AAW6BER4_9GAMM|nr:hypothetical protein [Photorhabdus bodei]MCC8466887.1 hypothetical protein [Photorhabdus bodei]MDB6370474.1 hypothetical protein [Photorhabdus bodei]
MTGVSECSQQRGSLKDDGYKFPVHPFIIIILNDLLFWWKFSIPSITDAQNIVWSVNSNGEKVHFYYENGVSIKNN